LKLLKLFRWFDRGPATICRRTTPGVSLRSDSVEPVISRGHGAAAHAACSDGGRTPSKADYGGPVDPPHPSPQLGRGTPWDILDKHPAASALPQSRYFSHPSPRPRASCSIGASATCMTRPRVPRNPLLVSRLVSARRRRSARVTLMYAPGPHGESSPCARLTTRWATVRPRQRTTRMSLGK